MELLTLILPTKDINGWTEFRLDYFKIWIKQDEIQVWESEKRSFSINKYGLGVNEDIWIYNHTKEDTFFILNWSSILSKGIERAYQLKEITRIIPFPIWEELELGLFYFLDFLRDFHPVHLKRIVKLTYDFIEFGNPIDINIVYNKLLDLIDDLEFKTFSTIYFKVLNHKEGWKIKGNKNKTLFFVFQNGDIVLPNKTFPIANLFLENLNVNDLRFY